MGTLHGPERLRVYHLALAFARQVDVMLRQTRCYRSLADQLLRAADSVILNISEGAANFSPGRKRYYYQIAHASAGECIGGLIRLQTRYPHADIQPLRRNADMICVMLMALLRSQQLPSP